MHLSKTQRYATRLLQTLQRSPGPMMKKDLAARLGISEGMVQQVMIPLLLAGLVASSKNSTAGGYMLANRRHEITIGHVVAAIPQANRDEEDELSGKVRRIVMHRLYRLPIRNL